MTTGTVPFEPRLILLRSLSGLMSIRTGITGSKIAKGERELTLAQMILAAVSSETVASTHVSAVPSPVVSS